MNAAHNYNNILFSSQNCVIQNLQETTFKQCSPSPPKTALEPLREPRRQTTVLVLRFTKSLSRLKEAKKMSWKLRDQKDACLNTILSAILLCLCLSLIPPTNIDWFLRNSIALGRQFSLWVAPLDYNLWAYLFGCQVTTVNFHPVRFRGFFPGFWHPRLIFQKENTMTELVKLSVII